MIQQSINVQAPPPRLHPKKRKFDLSELEDDHHHQQQQQQSAVPYPPPPSSISSLPSPSSTVTATVVHSVPSPVIISTHPTNSTATIVYQRHSSELSSNQNGNQHVLMSGNGSGVLGGGGNSNYSPHVATQVVKNAGDVQQINKRQFNSYR
jgi:hypothetical protein